MGIRNQVSTRTVTLVGYTKPRDYKAGKTDDGHEFPAGRSMKVWAFDPEDHDDMGVEMLKVKTDECLLVEKSLAGVGRGVQVEIDFVKSGQDLVLKAVRVPATAGKGS